MFRTGAELVTTTSGGDAILGNTRYYIPNTMVKPKSADDTTLETAWESRWPPGFEINRSDPDYYRDTCERSHRTKCTLKTSY